MEGVEFSVILQQIKMNNHPHCPNLIIPLQNDCIKYVCNLGLNNENFIKNIISVLINTFDFNFIYALKYIWVILIFIFEFELAFWFFNYIFFLKLKQMYDD